MPRIYLHNKEKKDSTQDLIFGGRVLNSIKKRKRKDRDGVSRAVCEGIGMARTDGSDCYWSFMLTTGLVLRRISPSLEMTIGFPIPIEISFPKYESPGITYPGL
jgi:hypothetical protein